MSWRPHPRRTTLNVERPVAWGTSDRSGFVGNHDRMLFQFQWAGSKLINTGLLVHADEYDQPNEQFRTLILPADPDPLFNARPEPLTIDQTDWLTTGIRGAGGDILATQSGTLLVTQPSATEAETEGTN